MLMSWVFELSDKPQLEGDLLLWSLATVQSTSLWRNWWNAGKGGLTILWTNYWCTGRPAHIAYIYYKVWRCDSDWSRWTYSQFECEDCSSELILEWWPGHVFNWDLKKHVSLLEANISLFVGWVRSISCGSHVCTCKRKSQRTNHSG